MVVVDTKYLCKKRRKRRILATIAPFNIAGTAKQE